MEVDVTIKGNNKGEELDLMAVGEEKLEERLLREKESPWNLLYGWYFRRKGRLSIAKGHRDLKDA